MKTVIEKRLFWFLKEGTELDLSDKAQLDMYIQQVLTRGKTSDIKKLFRIIAPSVFYDSFTRIKNFLPNEVRRFWEEGLEDFQGIIFFFESGSCKVYGSWWYSCKSLWN